MKSAWNNTPSFVTKHRGVENQKQETKTSFYSYSWKEISPQTARRRKSDGAIFNVHNVKDSKELVVSGSTSSRRILSRTSNKGLSRNNNNTTNNNEINTPEKVLSHVVKKHEEKKTYLTGYAQSASKNPSNSEIKAAHEKIRVITSDSGSKTNQSVPTKGFHLPANATWGKQRKFDTLDETSLNQTLAPCGGNSRVHDFVYEHNEVKDPVTVSTTAGAGAAGGGGGGAVGVKVDGDSTSAVVATTGTSIAGVKVKSIPTTTTTTTRQTAKSQHQTCRNGKKVHAGMNPTKNHKSPSKHSILATSKSTAYAGSVAMPSKLNSQRNSTRCSILPKNPLSKLSVATPRNHGDFTLQTLRTLPFDSTNQHTNHVHPTSSAFVHTSNMLPIGTTVKGKQRIKKRKKILSPLKKHILKERLLQWQKSQGLDGHNNQVAKDDLIGSGSGSEDVLVGHSKAYGSVVLLNGSSEHVSKVYSSIVYIKNYALLDELEDDDEYVEIVDNLKSLSEGIGAVSSVHVPRFVIHNEQELDPYPLVYVRFERINDALAAKACWNGMTFGGNQVVAGVIPKCLMNEAYDTQTEVDRWKKCVEHIPYYQLVEEIENISLQLQTRATANETTVLTLFNILTQEDLDDDECLEETLQDIRQVALAYGPLVEGTEGIRVDRTQNVINIKYKDIEHTIVAAAKLNGSVLGGIQICAKIERLVESDNSPLYIVHLENILCEDDYEDEDCLEATKEDVNVLANECGSPLKVDVHVNGKDRGRISIYYSTKEYACCAVAKFNGMIIGGKTVQVLMEESSPCNRSSETILELRNVLNGEDYEDEECLQETKKDILAMVQNYGKVKNLNVETTGRNRGVVSVAFVDSNIALQAYKKLNGKVVGGSQISANIIFPNYSSVSFSSERTDVIANNVKKTSEPLYSGDKIIPEQYAKCKRVPKIPNPGIPRDYAKRIGDSSVVPLLFDMLGELMRLQVRAKEINNKKAKRRLVLGLREVARGIRAQKVKMVIMANNLDQYGALDVKLQEILNAAKEHGVPVIFELNKRKLGKALGKTLKISVVGIENADGAYEPFKKLKRLYETT
jgi:selenocysteine insertion sequence-binding protein 2